MSVTYENVIFNGCVKWFNKRAGYGFITITNGNGIDPASGRNIGPGNDIFVHHSSIHVKQAQYTYLVEGEYVTFSIDPMADASGIYSKIQATNVIGIVGEVLSCESRKTLQSNKKEKSKSNKTNKTQNSMRRNNKRKYSANKRSNASITTENGMLTIRYDK